MTNFGAFIQITEGIEGMVHVSEISAEKRIAHPRDAMKLGQVVKALVLAIDREKRNIRLSIKQLVPTGLDEYLVEHKPGDLVTGRIVDLSGRRARVELGEGIQADCEIPVQAADAVASQANTKADLSSLGSMLQARWKGQSHQDEESGACRLRTNSQLPHSKDRRGVQGDSAAIVRVADVLKSCACPSILVGLGQDRPQVHILFILT